MHESNQVMRQFGCTQLIPPPPQELDDLHNTKLQERLKEDWPTFHKKYIKIWSRQRCYKRPRRGLINPRSRENVAGGTTSAPAPQEDPITVQPSGLYGSYIFCANLTARIQTQSTMEERDEDGDQPQHARKDDNEVDKESPTQIVQWNPKRARCLPGCSTHLGR
ncbi:hypothetical protein Gotri_012592 [Gossypium trilobum]|uniref:Uncharacterized protein n=1 Tax=Gossypium trilobum TaxID=34281 RepID=A0A7J9DRU4_9ROSI|nr:hypothetical protein [Gossypium trilobum]